MCVWEGDPSCSPGSAGEACGISIWRPVAPPGYVALGDCLVRGYDPPLSAGVAQDTGALFCLSTSSVRSCWAARVRGTVIEAPPRPLLPVLLHCCRELCATLQFAMPRCVCCLSQPSAPSLAGGEEGFGHTQGMPLVKAPRGFEPAWEDASSPPDSRLVLWRPVPYPG